MSKILILGCGPAGLMAAHAAVLDGHEVIIMSKPRKSQMFGAQYLHAPIPLASSSPAFDITYELRGTAEGYREKVYGPNFRGEGSPEYLEKTHSAWDIREAYDFLWNAYGSTVLDRNFAPSAAVQEALDWTIPDITISTIPAYLVCRNQCDFFSQKIWSANTSVNIPPDHVICNGGKTPAWYRAANIQGWTTVEWPQESKPPIPEGILSSVTKPTGNNCKCFPEIHRMGRYGKWEKGVLSHSAFYETAQLLSQPIQQRLI